MRDKWRARIWTGTALTLAMTLMMDETGVLFFLNLVVAIIAVVSLVLDFTSEG